MPVLTACRTCGKPTSVGAYCQRCLPAAQAEAQSRWRPGRGTKADRDMTAAVIERDQGICWLCGMPGATEKDHVIPYSRGGVSAMHNYRAAHRSCNAARGNRAA